MSHRNEVSLVKTPKLRLHRVELSDSARRMPVFVDAGPGTGKSRLLGRGFAWQDFVDHTPCIVLDPHGTTIDNFLDKLTRLPEDVPPDLREYLWNRIRYIDMSGSLGYVTPFPLYYRLGEESLFEIAQRYIDVVGKLDPNLQTASIEGWNAFKHIAGPVGMLLAATGTQITEAPHVLRTPEVWFSRLRGVEEIYGSELAPVTEFLSGYATTKETARPRITASFLNKVDQFELDPVMRAMFGATIPGINWQEVIEEGQMVLLDFRRVYDLERRQFLMMWSYQYLMSFIRHRGAGRHQPVSLIVDELAALFTMSSVVAAQFAADLDEMINQIARNYSLWVTLATQELYQFDERLQKTLLSMTVIQGRTSDPESAAMLAQRLTRYKPYLVKKWENVWGSSPMGSFIVEQRPVEFTPQEQQILSSYSFMDLRQFEFLARLPNKEGDYSPGVQRFSIAGLDPGHYPDENLVAEARQLLVQRDGTPISAALAEIAARQSSRKRVRSRRRRAAPDIMEASGELED